MCCSIENLAPNVFKTVPPRLRKSRIVSDAMIEHSWVSDIRGALSWQGLAEYLELWDALAEFAVNDTKDLHHWKFEASRTFSTRSAYRAFLKEPLALNLGRGSGNPGHSVSAKPLFGWPFAIDVGLLIVCKKQDYLTLLAARCVTKKKRRSNIYSLLVCSHGNFGSAFSSH